MINVLNISRLSIVIAMVAFHGLANADLSDLVKTKTESSETFLVYDLAGFTGTKDELKDRVREALSYQGDNAFVKDNLQVGDVPRYPGKLAIKPLAVNLPIEISIPSCNGAAFTVSSSDNSLAQYGENARYMACGFPYSGGYRVDFYAAYSVKSGGLAGILSGRTLGGGIAGALGLGSNPKKFIDSSISKLEELFKSSGWNFALVEMAPVITGKTIVADPLSLQQVTENKRSYDREKRLAARSELNKLGIDASDRERLLRAIKSGDDDLVDLFLEAGAVDVKSRDANGKTMAEYASKPKMRDLLAADH